MNISKLACLLVLAIAVPALASSEQVAFSVSTVGTEAVSEDLVAELVVAEVSNLSGSEIRNVTLRPDGSAQVSMIGDVLQFGALAAGGTKSIRHSFHRRVEDDGAQAPITWRLDFDDTTGQHQRLFISTE